MNLTFEKPLYSTYIGSHSVKLTCVGTNLNPSDIVWIVSVPSYPIAMQKVIYSDSTYIGDSSRKYSIEITNIVSKIELNISNETDKVVQNRLNTSLIIHDIQEQDFMYGYECVCNIYKKCSNTNHAMANASLFLTQTPFAFMSNLNITNAGSCLNGFYNQTQYILVLLSLVLLIGSSIMLHYSDPSILFFILPGLFADTRFYII